MTKEFEFAFSIGDTLYSYSMTYLAIIRYEIDQLIIEEDNGNVKISYRLKEFASDAFDVTEPVYYYIYCSEDDLKTEFFNTREEAKEHQDELIEHFKRKKYERVRQA